LPWWRDSLTLERRGLPLELLMELHQALYDKFDYAPNITRVDSPIDDALRARRGVCQDFAYIRIAQVRQLKIPCRYVSGYLFPADKAKDRSPAGSDARLGGSVSRRDRLGGIRSHE